MAAFKPSINPSPTRRKCRIQVTLASGIPEEICNLINLGYRDPRSIVTEDFAGREETGVLLVPKAGERLRHLKKRPDWAREM
jgi:lactate racemase